MQWNFKIVLLWYCTFNKKPSFEAIRAICIQKEIHLTCLWLNPLPFGNFRLDLVVLIFWVLVLQNWTWFGSNGSNGNCCQSICYLHDQLKMDFLFLNAATELSKQFQCTILKLGMLEIHARLLMLNSSQLVCYPALRDCYIWVPNMSTYRALASLPCHFPKATLFLSPEQLYTDIWRNKNHDFVIKVSTLKLHNIPCNWWEV